mmetsp:Transcript_1090/g.1149  ORF Transcript_1090/g.1149 Transcript_1090/m.1149 type:complete len:82 (-) Transcript_1090:117-362(-)
MDGNGALFSHIGNIKISFHCCSETGDIFFNSYSSTVGFREESRACSKARKEEEDRAQKYRINSKFHLVLARLLKSNFADWQ